VQDSLVFDMKWLSDGNFDMPEGVWSHQLFGTHVSILVDEPSEERARLRHAFGGNVTLKERLCEADCRGFNLDDAASKYHK
jgi:hypothetical protein